jgi:hypothetical protein
MYTDTPSVNGGNNTNWSFNIAPDAITQLSASMGNNSGLIDLIWTSPGDDASTNPLNPGTYRIFYSTSSGDLSGLLVSTTSTASRNRLDISTSSVSPGTSQYLTLSGLIKNGATYYFRIYTADEGSNWSAISYGATAYTYTEFDPNQIDVDGAGGGLSDGGLSWGDYDNDGDLDILVSGTDVTNYQLRIYKNNGNGTFNSAQVEVDATSGGLTSSEVAWSDYDNDGDLDVFIHGKDVDNNYQLRLYTKLPGDNFVGGDNINSLNGGLQNGGLSLGDLDNDGDLDLVESGADLLRIFYNNGNGGFNPLEVNVDGAGGGTSNGNVALADLEKDGDLDILECGINGANRKLRVYKNNGNGSFNTTEVDLDGSTGGLTNSAVAWGDFDLDGDLDVVDDVEDGHGDDRRDVKPDGDVEVALPAAGQGSEEVDREDDPDRRDQMGDGPRCHPQMPRRAPGKLSARYAIRFSGRGPLRRRPPRGSRKARRSR